MAKFLITSPDGRKFNVTGDNAQGAYEALVSHLGVTPANRDGKGDLPDMGTQAVATDAAKSFGAGALSGAENLAGGFGDSAKMSSDLLASGVKALGGGETAQGVAGTVGRLINGPFAFAPTTQQLQQAAEPLTQGADQYQPQSTVGQYAKTVGEFAPNAVMGEGGVAKRVIQTVVPAVASEAAGQLTKGTPLEPLARVGGAVAGGGLTAAPELIAGMRQKANILNSAMTQPDVAAQANKMYDSLRSSGVAYDADKFTTAVDDLTSQLKAAGMRKAQQPLAADALDSLQELSGAAPDFNDVESARKTASSIFRNKNASDDDRKFASDIVDTIDKFTGGDNYAGNVDAAQQSGLMSSAREMARRNILAKQIDDMVDSASTKQMGMDQALRNQFTKYLDSGKAKSLTDEERAAFMSVAKGNFGRNVLTTLGKAGVDPSSKGNLALFGPALVADLLGGHGAFTAKTAIGLGGASALKVGGRMATEAAANAAKKTVLLGKRGQNALSNLQVNAPNLAQPQAVNALSAFTASRPMMVNALSGYGAR